MRNKTATFRFDSRDHEILNSLAKARGQNKTQVLKRMLREEEAREEILKRDGKCKKCSHPLERVSPFTVVCTNEECANYLAPIYRDQRGDLAR